MASRMKETRIEEKTELEALLSLVWRWKILYALIILIAVSLTAGWYRSKPIVYGTTVNVKIGRIANTLVEPWADIESSMRIYEDEARTRRLLYTVFQSSPQRQDETRGTLVVTLIAQSSSPDDARAFAVKLAGDLVSRQKRIFEKADAAFIKNRPIGGDYPLYLIETYTAPSRVIGQPEPYSARSVSGGIVNPSSPGMGLKQYLALSFSLGVFAGLLCIYVLDFVLRRRRSLR
jgi:hypothetical protein